MSPSELGEIVDEQIADWKRRRLTPGVAARGMGWPHVGSWEALRMLVLRALWRMRSDKRI